MSALLADLQTKRLVDQTPVVLGAEFGRTSRSNDNGGWDHIQRQVLGDAE